MWIFEVRIKLIAQLCKNIYSPETSLVHALYNSGEFTNLLKYLHTVICVQSQQFSGEKKQFWKNKMENVKLVRHESLTTQSLIDWLLIENIKWNLFRSGN